MIGLAQYYKVLVDNGYENIDFITDITWEDLRPAPTQATRRS